MISNFLSIVNEPMLNNRFNQNTFDRKVLIVLKKCYSEYASNVAKILISLYTCNIVVRESYLNRWFTK